MFFPDFGDSLYFLLVFVEDEFPVLALCLICVFHLDEGLLEEDYLFLSELLHLLSAGHELEVVLLLCSECAIPELLELGLEGSGVLESL